HSDLDLAGRADGRRGERQTDRERSARDVIEIREAGGGEEVGAVGGAAVVHDGRVYAQSVRQRDWQRPRVERQVDRPAREASEISDGAFVPVAGGADGDAGDGRLVDDRAR